MGIHHKLASTIVSFLLFSHSAIAGNCSFLGDPEMLSNGQLFYLAPTSNRWTQLGSEELPPADQNLSFAYVVSETVSQQRSSGAVVFKSGRRRTIDESAGDDQVTLDRDLSDSIEGSSCKRPRDFRNRPVSARSYDSFHDLGEDVPVPDRDTLKDFHYLYSGRNGCKKPTDSLDKDSRIPYDGRSNRSQFSFDLNVVRSGVPDRYAVQLRHFVDLFYPSAASASSSTEYADRRVQLHAYTLRPGLPTCVKFKMRVPKRMGFLRINDLEALKQQGIYLLRADELPEWTLSR